MEHKRYKIGTGDQAIYQTIEHMKRLAIRDSKSEEIRNIANQIKSKCGNNQECLAETAFDWVYNNIKYEFDDILVEKYQDKYFTQKIENPKNEEFITAPKYILKLKVGDCDDMSTLLASIYIALGLPVNFKIIAHKSKAYSHVYTEVGVKIKGKSYWIPSDPVIKKFAFEKAPIIRVETFRVDK